MIYRRNSAFAEHLANRVRSDAIGRRSFCGSLWVSRWRWWVGEVRFDIISRQLRLDFGAERVIAGASRIEIRRALIRRQLARRQEQLTNLLVLLGLSHRPVPTNAEHLANRVRSDAIGRRSFCGSLWVSRWRWWVGEVRFDIISRQLRLDFGAERVIAGASRIEIRRALIRRQLARRQEQLTNLLVLLGLSHRPVPLHRWP